MKKLTLTFLFIAFTSMLFAQQSVQKIDGNNDAVAVPSTHHFYYLLPKTVFKVEVKVEKTTQYKGIYSDYAQKLLGINNVINHNEESYRLQSVSILDEVHPDETQCYLVNLSKDQIKDQMLMKMFSAADKIKRTENEEYSTPKNEEIPEFFKNYYEKTYTQQENSYIDTRIVDGVVRQVPVNQIKTVKVSVEQQAKEAVEIIAKAQEDRYDLLIGSQEVNYSKSAIALMVKKLDEIINNHLQLFTGYSLSETETHTLYITPQDQNAFAFALNPSTGLQTEMSKKMQENYYLAFESLTFSSQWKNHKKDLAQITEKPKKISYWKLNNGYTIRQSVATQVSLTNKNQIVTKFGTFPIFQFGELTTLPKMDDFNISKWGYIKF